MELTKIRFDAGLASDFDVAQAEGEVKTTEAQIPTLQTALKQTAYRIDILLGAQPGASWSELANDAPVPALPPEAHVGLPIDLLRRRPDIRSAERQLAAATAQVGAATADLYPKFSLTGLDRFAEHQRERLVHRGRAVSGRSGRRSVGRFSTPAGSARHRNSQRPAGAGAALV